MGVVAVKTGTIQLDGVGDHQGHAIRTRAQRGGYVPQGREIFGRLTVQENLRMGLAYRRRGACDSRRLFELFPVLKQMINRRGGDLSGGQQQAASDRRALWPRDPSC